MLAGHGIARVAEHVEHRVVLGERVGREPLDAALAGPPARARRGAGPESVMLVLVRHHEGDLRLGACRRAIRCPTAMMSSPAVTTSADAVLEVHLREACDLGLGERRVEREEAHVDRLGRQVGVEGDQAGRIVGPDGSDMAVHDLLRRHRGRALGRRSQDRPGPEQRSVTLPAWRPPPQVGHATGRRVAAAPDPLGDPTS